ncbi:phytoene desaturase family protein [Perlabentimonas gracilis]|uniref:phytoene desaturase family protein n=1 Tax=Perlabentimonas gracilis TaxID=2715279 RepID=UPI00140793A2|nr:NAD(P)/FAD-dependent oxidoreductase [Perlabentimonas gracilis]NHB67759.1 NAD(P)/FAD-dependent oxidoreductase [Perlabentimonas gracilis]
MSDNSYDTIVVGGGIAGLTATTYLAREGQNVLLIEKNRELGGLVNSFTRNGFHFDAGVRALEDAGIIFPMLKDLNIELEVVKSPVSLGVENKILNIKNIDSLKDYKQLLKKFYPESEKEIDEVVKTIRKIMKYMDVLYGIENPLFKDLKRDTSFIFKKLLPWMPRFLFTVGKINRMQVPVEDYLNSVVKNPSLRDIIAQHFFKNTPTFFALSYFSLYLDYFYPKGGVGKLADALYGKIIEFGGEIKTATSVTAISPDNKTVVDEKGNTYNYKNLIWAADLKTLYRIAETEKLSEEIKSNFEERKAKILSSKGGESVFTLFLQVDEPLETFGKIANGHFFYTPSRQGLGETHRKELYELLDNFSNVSKQQILDWLNKFITLNTFEISIPGLRDKELAPPGKTGMIISFLADYELFKKINEAGWLEEFNSGIEELVLKVISESVFPMLKDKVIGRFSFSPLSYHNRTASSEGAIVGWEFQKDMPVINKIQIADRSVYTPLPDVYQAGQWAYSPAGVPMSILTGKIAANKILKSKK